MPAADTGQHRMNATASITYRTQTIGAFDGMAPRAACRLLEAILAVRATPGAVFGRRALASSCTMTMLQIALLLLAPGAQAQSNACDLLKIELAARIDATGVHGYSLEAVPADTPVPPGAKAIGNCEAGARKIVYRRWAAAQPSSADAGATVPASAAQPRVVPDKAAPRPTVAQNDRASPPTAAASAPGSAPRSTLRSSAPASAAATPGPAAEKSVPAAGASELAVVPAVERALAQPAPPSQPAMTPAAQSPRAQRATDFMAENWRWLLALIVLPLAGLVWAWYAHRSAYDEAGLPRGPKL
jgi:hypothetical protein